MKPVHSKCLTAMLGLVMFASLGLRWGVSPALAQAEPVSRSEFNALKDELARLRIGFEGMKRDLELLRQRAVQRLPQATRPPDVVAQVRIAGNPSLGRADAPLTMIEFSDFQCPYCRRFFETTLPALKAEYIDIGKLRYVFRDFPLDRLHPQARKAAEAAHCAGDQGKYWQMHEVLFHNQKALQVEHLKTYAYSLNLNHLIFDDCLEQGKYAVEVQKDFDEGAAAGVQGTPGFFLGKTQADDVVQGIFLKGAQPIAAFRQVIERLLSGQ